MKRNVLIFFISIMHVLSPMSSMELSPYAQSSSDKTTINEITIIDEHFTITLFFHDKDDLIQRKKNFFPRYTFNNEMILKTILEFIQDNLDEAFSIASNLSQGVSPQQEKVFELAIKDVCHYIESQERLSRVCSSVIISSNQSIIPSFKKQYYFPYQGRL